MEVLGVVVGCGVKEGDSRCQQFLVKPFLKECLLNFRKVSFAMN